MVTIGMVGVAIAVIGSGLFIMCRPWQLSWGATSEELARSMPGDEVVSRPTFNTTRAVTVKAEPEDIWPWIVQMGFGRGGWYSYDLLDNLGHHSAERIIPALQHIQVDDLIPMGPGADSGMRVKEFLPDRSILWWNKKNPPTTWAWTLDPTPDGTRLVTRVRSRSSWTHPSSMFWRLITEVADFPMMRKCLLGIKRRAEMERSVKEPLQGLSVLLGVAVVFFSALYLASDLIELAQRGFSTPQLALTFAGEAAIPLFVVGLYAVQRPGIGRLGLIGAVVYAYSFVFFTGTVMVALVDRVPDWNALLDRMGPWATIHGALMVLAGLAFGLAVIRAGVLPRWTGFALMSGVVLVAAASGLSEIAQTAAAGVRDLAFAGMGASLLFGRRPALGATHPSGDPA